MPSLVLGVLDVAYSDSHGIRKGETTTTGDVAEILEERYHVMQTFYQARKEKIASFLADTMASALQDICNGQRVKNPSYGAEQRIEAEFRSFLDANEMQKLAIALTGVALSAAAARGVNHRKKNPYAKKNKERPAFVDTGLYRSSFRAQLKLQPSQK